MIGHQPGALKARRIKSIEELETQYYFRFSAEDRPGVLSKIAGILGEHQISIQSVHQQGRDQVGAVPIVMITHEASEAGVKQALFAIDHLDIVKDKTMLIRIENWN